MLLLILTDSNKTEFPHWHVTDSTHAYTHSHTHALAYKHTTHRYVMEDRFSAIRAAIGTAGKGDVVVILGRGHTDFMEYGEEDVSLLAC